MFAEVIEAPGIPVALDEMKPGPRLAAVLSSIDVERLSGRDAVLFARAQQRQIAHDQARQYRALSRVGDLYTKQSTDEDLYEFASAEIGAALTYTRYTSNREMTLAFDLIHRFPDLLTAFESGAIDLGKVRVILRGVGHLVLETARQAVTRILPLAPDLTTGQIAVRLRKIVIEVDPQAAQEAYDQGVKERMVWSELAPDGTGTMIATGLPAPEMAAANRNINGMAWKLKQAGDDRPIDVVRCDVFLQLLTGGIGGAFDKAQVNITGDLATLAGLAEHPGEPDGFGPVIADIIRQVARQQHNARWMFQIRNPETGEVFVGTTSRRPSVGQRRKLVARYPTCIHPGCRRPAIPATSTTLRIGPTAA